MYEIIFLRHGISEGVERGILQGHLDLPLTDSGRVRINALGKYWRLRAQTFDQIITSPLMRAKETAQIIAAHLEIQEVFVDPGWIERGFGDGEGADLRRIADWYVDCTRPTVFEPIYDTGESEWQIHMRAGKAVEQLLALPEGKILVVAHGNIINAALRMIIGVLPAGRSLPVEMALDPGCYAWLRYNPVTGRWSMVSFNDHSFLLNCA